MAGSTDWIKTVDIGKDGFTSTEQKRIYELLADYSDIFSKGEYDLGRINVIEHGIDLNGPKPKRCGPRPLNPTLRVELEKQLKEMMDHDIIQPSRSEFACPVVLVKKKDGSIRFCCDFRRLNDVTRRDSYPLPKINELINTLSGAKLFTTLDFRSGYHQIALNPEDRHKTAFTTQFGLFEWKVMPMGLCNSPGSFSRLMDLIIVGLNWNGVLLYLDDLLIFGKDYDEHFDRLKEVFQRLRQANLKLSPKKCHILQREVNYLGHIISNGEVKPDPAKTKIIDTYPTPKSIKDVRAFMGLASYYRKFVKNFATLVKPLTCMLEKGSEFHWTLECQHAFDTVKAKLSNETRLNLPDFSRTFRLACDASGIAVGAVLSQINEDGKESPISFASKVLSKTERKWTVTERECYALYWGVTYYRSILYGKPFELISDHRPLLWLQNLKNPSPKLARWLIALEEFEFTITYREGKRNGNADAMTRIPGVDAIEVVEFEGSVTKESIKQYQNKNELIKEIKMYLDRKEEWPNTATMRPFAEKKHELFVNNEVLYRQVSDEHIQVILPLSMHKEVLQQLHDSPTGGHLGVDKTEQRFLANFYSPKARKLVADYIRKCSECEWI